MALDPKQNQLPQLPMDLDPALRNYLEALQAVVAAEDIDDTPPSLVTSVTLNSVYIENQIFKVFIHDRACTELTFQIVGEG